MALCVKLTCSLTLKLRCWLAAESAEDAADPALLLLSRGLLSVRASLVLVAENRAQDSCRQLSGIFAGGQQVVQFHLCDLLNVGSNLRMLERSCHDHRQHE